jgi:pectate lyase
MALLLVWGGMVSTCLVGGCADNIVHPYRQIYTDGGTGGSGDSGGLGGAGGDDAGIDTLPITCPTTLVGYATLDGGTTGGGDGPVYTADALEQLRTFAGLIGPAIVRINGTIVISPDAGIPVEVESDKTVIPVKPGDGLVGNGLSINKVHNVIVRNLTISRAAAPWDAITVQASNNVWIDHCDLSNDLNMPKEAFDDLLDITHGSSNITVSWTRFHDAYNTGIVGHTDTPTAGNMEDLGLAVTYHHNLFSNTLSESPRVRFGHAHLFSNYYNAIQLPSAPTTSYGIASTMGATVRIESNLFDQVAIPIVTHLDGTPVDGTVNISAADTKNGYNPMSSAAANVITTTPNTNWRPTYLYADSVDSPVGVRVIVPDCAGVGHVP